MNEINNFIVVVFLILSSCKFFVSMSPILPSGSSEDSNINNRMINVVSEEPVDSISRKDDISFDYENQLKEEVKARLLKHLHRKEPPKSHVPLPQLQTLNFRPTKKSQESEKHIIKSTDSASISNTTKRTKTDFLYADIENATCFDNNGNPCIRFHIELSPRIQNFDFEFVELWLYKKRGVTEYAISRILQKSADQKLTISVYNQTHSEGWTRFNVSQILYDVNETSLDLEIYTEFGEPSLKVDEAHRPFLLVKHEDKLISKRTARDCTPENTTCCREKYYVHFKDVGWAEWIVQPEGYDANYCKGSCSGNIGLASNHHGHILMNLCEKKPYKAREIGKNECISCSPTAYNEVSVIYLDQSGVQVISHMRDMSVTKCGCT